MGSVQSEFSRIAAAATVAAMLMLPAALAPSAFAQSRSQEFGVVSPELNDCFRLSELPPECRTSATDGDSRLRRGPFRISATAKFGIDYDGSRFVPTSSMEILFEASVKTDAGLGFNSRLSLPAPVENN